MPLRWFTSLANFWLAISCATLSTAEIVHAASLTTADTKDGKTILALDGVIEAGDGLKLAWIVRALHNEKRNVSALYLNSRGGNHHGAVQMAEVVKHHKISTIVADGSKCASGCFTVFAAGHEKLAHHRARIGVHRSSQDGDDTEVAFTATFKTAKLLSELGVPPAIVGKQVLTPSDRMAWLSPDDLRSMNVTLAGNLRRPAELAVAVEPPPPLTPFEAAAKPAGLNWSQYVAETSELSRQRFGLKYLHETCDLRSMTCSRYYHFAGKDDIPTTVTTFEDMSGNVVRREVCKFNMARTVRACFDWDTLEKSHAAKGKDGRWQWVPAKGIESPPIRPPHPFGGLVAG